MWTIAQQATKEDLTRFLVTIAVLIAVVLVAGLVLLMVRKRMMSAADENVMSGSIFDDLRRMLKDGEISEVEYDYLRRCIAAKAAGKEPPPMPAELKALQDLRAEEGFDLTGAPIPPEVLAAMRRHESEGR